VTPELLRRVEALLRVHEEVGDFLEAPAVADPSGVARPAPQASLEEAAAPMIGRYKLSRNRRGRLRYRLHGRAGGAGAPAASPLKSSGSGWIPGRSSPASRPKRQALALMDHPHRPGPRRGATAAGRPYFVMELVRGVKITDYCDQHNLPTAERLQLFTQVCHAVQHAHQKGIIHRTSSPRTSWSPSRTASPCQGDRFRHRQATQGRLTDKTLFTAFEQFIGTPAYMSPDRHN